LGAALLVYGQLLEGWQRNGGWRVLQPKGSKSWVWTVEATTGGKMDSYTFKTPVGFVRGLLSQKELIALSIVAVVVGVYPAAVLEIDTGLPTEVFKFLILPLLCSIAARCSLASPLTTQGRFHG
jgi:hypothetical protein